MPIPTEQTDFILHIGPHDAGEVCALLRTEGEDWIEQGYVTAKAAVDDAFDVMLVTSSQTICLVGVGRRHMDLIRGQGLYVVQRMNAETDTQAVLMEWREC
jgi:hypothetical protein